jgi:dTDP-glucose 4,6-dehydratase
VEKLLENSNKVIVIDNLITGNKKNIDQFMDNANFEFIEHDIQERIYIKEKLDYIVHLASCASPKAYSQYPINTLKSGSIGTINALGIAKKHNAKFFLASTSEVYGDPRVSPQDENYWGNVNTLGPRSMYDESKRFAESATKAYMTTHGIQANIARIFNTYGPNMQIDDGRVVTNFIYQAINNEDITIYGTGNQTRSFSFIEDTLDGLLKVMNYKNSDVFNIGSENEITVKHLAKTIISLTNSNSKIAYKEIPKDDPKQRKPDLTKAKEQLNYAPRYSLEEGLKITIDWITKTYK